MKHKEFQVILRVKADLSNPHSQQVLTEAVVKRRIEQMVSFCSVLDGVAAAGEASVEVCSVVMDKDE